MTREKAISYLGMAVPIMALTVERFAEFDEAIRMAVQALEEPERKKGNWIESHEHVYIGNGVKEWTNWYCSECDAPNDKPTDFCPSCGADMRGEQDG